MKYDRVVVRTPDGNITHTTTSPDKHLELRLHDGALVVCTEQFLRRSAMRGDIYKRVSCYIYAPGKWSKVEAH